LKPKRFASCIFYIQQVANILVTMLAIFFSLLVVPCLSFHLTSSSRSRGSSLFVMKEFSKALPFLVKPDKLDGTSPVCGHFQINFLSYNDEILLTGRLWF